MKPILNFAAALFLLSATAQASVLTLTNLTRFSMPDTNIVRMVEADTNTPTMNGGQVTTIGFPTAIYPNSNGVWSVYAAAGNYVFYGMALGQGLLYRFPDSTSNSTAIPLSGFNTFQTPTVIINTNIGGGGSATNALAQGPGGAYDASLVTNVQSTALVGQISLAQLPAQVVTNTYNLKSFGAYGDAHSATGALALSNTPTITVTGGYFVAGDVGSFIRFKDADLNRNDWWTTITVVNSPTSITVAAAVPVSYNLALPGGVGAITTGYQVDYGHHDDSTAAQAFINQETNWGGLFYCPPGHYLIVNPPTNNNAQLVVPCSPNAGNNNSPFMELYGRVGSQSWYYSGSQPNVQWDSNTTVFISNLGTSANPGGWTNGIPSSVIDFRMQTNTYGLQISPVTIPGSGGKITNNPVLPFIHDLVFDRGFDAGGITLNLLAAGQAELSKLWVGNFTAQSYIPAPQNTNHWDIVASDNFNGSGNNWYDINTGAGYNGIDLGLGYGNVLNFYCNSNAVTSVFTGASGQQEFHNVQLTCCNNFLYGSGGGQPYYTGSGAAAGTFIPQMYVSTYQTTLAGASVPAWTTNGVCLVYDPNSKIANGGVLSTPGHVYFSPGAGSGAPPWVNQGPGRNVFVDQDLGSAGVHAFQQPQSFGGSVVMTNGLTITNAAPLVLGSGINIQAYPLQIYSPGDYVYQEFWPGPSRFIRWLVGTEDRLVAGFTNCFAWYPYNGPLPGIGGYGPVMSLDPLGNLTVVGAFTGSGAGLTGIPTAATPALLDDYMSIDQQGPYDQSTILLPQLGGSYYGFGKLLSTGNQTFYFDPPRWTAIQWSGLTNQVLFVHIFATNGATVAWQANVRYWTNGLTSGSGSGVQDKMFATGVFQCTAGVTNDYWITATNNWPLATMTNVTLATFYLGAGSPSTNVWVIQGTHIHAQ